MSMSATQYDEGKRPPAAARFDRLYRRYHANVSAYCRRRVSADRVDDVVAETFLTAWRRIDDVPDDDAALMWLYRVAYRTVGHHWRSTSRRRRLEERLAMIPEPPHDPPDDSAVHADEIRRVLEAAAHLSDRDAEVLRLASWEHLSRAEIAEVLDIDPNAVSQRLHRARANLTKHFNRLESKDRTPAAQKGGTS
jgi:RNA polymerase sigma-70 factor (ECF subfamily)